MDIDNQIITYIVRRRHCRDLFFTTNSLLSSVWVAVVFPPLRPKITFMKMFPQTETWGAIPERLYNEALQNK